MDPIVEPVIGTAINPVIHPIADSQLEETSPQHPQKDEIIRQVEYYFSDENLPKDAHLLALAGGDGNGLVELRKILGFPRMRRYKPKLLVKAALAESRELEIVDNKWIRRRIPLEISLEVEPKLSPGIQSQYLVSADKPWLTKGMLKPTGFEANHVEGPVSIDQYNIERELYSSENTFISRIEEAVNRFCRNRKMHQTTRNIFVKFMRFGGIAHGEGQFGSAANRKQLKREGLDDDEIDRLTANFSVDHTVIASFDEMDPASGEWYVDFVALAKAFLSSHYMTYFAWDDEQLIATTCNVLRNFYNYLLVHSVCPEYHQQLLEAREICDLAEDELIALVALEQSLPGSFNVACSSLFGGCYAGMYRESDASWHECDDVANIGMADDEARQTFAAGMKLFGVDASTEDEQFTVITEENIGLEVVEIKPSKRELSQVSGLGKLVCKYWKLPYDETQIDDNRRFEFIMDQKVLDNSFVGLKLDAVVKQFANGSHWIDQVYAAHPSYFTWLANEEVTKRHIVDPWESKPDVEMADFEGDDCESE